MSNSYHLSFGKDKIIFSSFKGITDKFVSGWQVTRFFQWASGEPANLPGNARRLTDTRVKDVNWNQHQVRGYSNCVVRQNNMELAARCLTRWPLVAVITSTLKVGCGSATFSPGQTAPLFGNLRKHRVPTLDASLLKTTIFKERYRFQFSAAFGCCPFL